MYSVFFYGRMIADRVRMDAYCEALRRAVQPGSTVLDIGTGTGIMALLACRFGARHVYAVEPSEAIHVARKMAADNGFLEQITFLQDLSTRVNLPEKVDVIVSDVRGNLPLLGQSLGSLMDARDRHLAREGQMIPQRDLMQVALVGASSLYSRYEGVCGTNLYGLDLSGSWPYVASSIYREELRPEHLLLEPRVWCELDYRTLSTPHARGQAEWTLPSGSRIYGLGLWFDAQLLDGVGFSNAPLYSPLIYGRTFLPLREPLDAQAGEQVVVSLRAQLVAEGYVWSWQVEVLSPGSTRARLRSKQSTFEGIPMAPGTLARHDHRFVPSLNEAGRVELAILELMDGQRPLEQIAGELTRRFPTRYPTITRAMAEVGALAVKFGS
ncbi:MAG: hypothetical protein AMXMBFR33_46280 [Candidatus Xenobia bacterium]